MFVYVTAATRDEGMMIARALVEERLAACANLFDGVTSVYRWEGGVQEEREVTLIAKTTADRCDVLVSRIRALHSYETPCIVAWPITAGHAGFLDWIRAETRRQ